MRKQSKTVEETVSHCWGENQSKLAEETVIHSLSRHSGTVDETVSHSLSRHSRTVESATVEERQCVSPVVCVSVSVLAVADLIGARSPQNAAVKKQEKGSSNISLIPFNSSHHRDGRRWRSVPCVRTPRS